MCWTCVAHHVFVQNIQTMSVSHSSVNTVEERTHQCQTSHTYYAIMSYKWVQFGLSTSRSSFILDSPVETLSLGMNRILKHQWWCVGRHSTHSWWVLVYKGWNVLVLDKPVIQDFQTGMIMKSGVRALLKKLNEPKSAGYSSKLGREG